MQVLSMTLRVPEELEGSPWMETRSVHGKYRVRSVDTQRKPNDTLVCLTHAKSDDFVQLPR